jgi:hypothetical protein
MTWGPKVARNTRGYPDGRPDFDEPGTDVSPDENRPHMWNETSGKDVAVPAYVLQSSGRSVVSGGIEKSNDKVKPPAMAWTR